LAQAAQPVQLSSLSINEKLYSLLLASFDNAKTSEGQATTHRSQPLHLSVFTTIAPFNFAMIYKLVVTNTNFLIKLLNKVTAFY